MEGISSFGESRRKTRMLLFEQHLLTLLEITANFLCKLNRTLSSPPKTLIGWLDKPDSEQSGNVVFFRQQWKSRSDVVLETHMSLLEGQLRMR
jgi:hypothetical protein